SDRLLLDGIMGYEAQVAGLPDRTPGQGLRGPVIRALKRRSVRTVRERRAAIVRAVEAVAGPLRFVNGGGTGSLETTTAEDVVTEAAAGSAFFAPGLFDHYDAFRHLPAAAFAIPVVRRPAPDVYTCLGGGYIASGATGASKQPVPYLPAGARLLTNEEAGEVQTPIRYRGPERLAIGDPVFLRHAKAGELCERFDRLLLATADGMAGEVPTYRGDALTFL
ncbi:MAG TPA: amino acid deaminase/aldolase, partial [Actinomycetota bacterium]|nr:amino acid deaminase/aldolase [Actinomycetota bacterium]